MRYALPFLAFSLSLSACEYHECGPCDDGFWEDCDHNDCHDWDDDEDHEWADNDDDDGGGEDTGEEQEPEEPEYSYSLSPAEAEPGDSFIGSLVAEGEEAPGYDAITSIEFYGDVQVLASEVRGDELLLSLSVDFDAELGAVDLLVEFDDGDAAWVESVLVIYEVGSGHSSDSGDGGETDPCE